MKLDTLDKWFSRYIRLRDSYDGYGNCCTCSENVYIKAADCGHYKVRANMSTRYSEINCALQCKECNNSVDGQDVKFEEYLISVYGIDAVDELKSMAKQVTKYSQREINELAEHYRKEVKRLEIENNFKF